MRGKNENSRSRTTRRKEKENRNEAVLAQLSPSAQAGSIGKALSAFTGKIPAL
jgi:hypothetical protein